MEMFKYTQKQDSSLVSVTQFQQLSKLWGSSVFVVFKSS